MSGIAKLPLWILNATCPPAYTITRKKAIGCEAIFGGLHYAVWVGE